MKLRCNPAATALRRTSAFGSIILAKSSRARARRRIPITAGLTLATALITVTTARRTGPLTRTKRPIPVTTALEKTGKPSKTAASSTSSVTPSLLPGATGLIFTGRLIAKTTAGSRRPLTKAKRRRTAAVTTLD